ncbi:MAG: DUF2281 domain-containing protein [Candidatus Azobacteroides sp.]|nr:DUF2281 domain-containing protein [Candidatus Azobacteroides sp.]
METDNQVYQKIDMLPSDLKEEVLDFIDFIPMKRKNKKAVHPRPVFGCAKGQFSMSEDFGAPLDDFKEYRS